MTKHTLEPDPSEKRVIIIVLDGACDYASIIAGLKSGGEYGLAGS